ncbi:MAG: hypothetical protein KDA57_19885 [Planctomycetales bacterium]|nr:hypothetical protein [Planctomycetales bacterium]
MKWPGRQARRQQIVTALLNFSQAIRPLAGLVTSQEVDALSMQIIASLRREEYFRIIQMRGSIAANRADPNDPAFEAEFGIVHFLQAGMIDDAAWLIFLMVYFAKPEVGGWTRLRDVYGRLGNGRWDWATVSANPTQFTTWLGGNWQQIGGKFGSHRKYESLRPDASRPMGQTVETYVAWVLQGGGHAKQFASIVHGSGNDPNVIFDAIYRALPVRGFGRLGRFDWVCMLARYGLIHARAGSAYLRGATGPANGARLLFTNNRKAQVSDASVQGWLDELDQALGVGMEVLEDALCNWQKNPQRFVHFRG